MGARALVQVVRGPVVRNAGGAVAFTVFVVRPFAGWIICRWRKRRRRFDVERLETSVRLLASICVLFFEAAERYFETTYLWKKYSSKNLDGVKSQQQKCISAETKLKSACEKSDSFQAKQDVTRNEILEVRQDALQACADIVLMMDRVLEFWGAILDHPNTLDEDKLIIGRRIWRIEFQLEEFLSIDPTLTNTIEEAWRQERQRTGRRVTWAYEGKEGEKSQANKSL